MKTHKKPMKGGVGFCNSPTVLQWEKKLHNFFPIVPILSKKFLLRQNHSLFLPKKFLSLYVSHDFSPFLHLISPPPLKSNIWMKQTNSKLFFKNEKFRP